MCLFSAHFPTIGGFTSEIFFVMMFFLLWKVETLKKSNNLLIFQWYYFVTKIYSIILNLWLKVNNIVAIGSILVKFARNDGN